MKKLALLSTAASIALLNLALNSAALANEDNAQLIMEKMDEQQRLVSDGSLTRSQLSTCKFGQKDKQINCVETPRVKVLESVSKQYGPDKKDSKGVSILLEPASERGIGMLTYNYDDPGRDTESWLYLSALGKVKRMASGTGEDSEPVSVFGSEFTTEDMESGNTNEYDYKILQEGPFGDRQVWVIEAIPKPVRAVKTEYSKLLYWVDKERYTLLKAQTYDKRGKAYKQLTFKNIEKINDLWIARDVTLINLQSQRLSNMKTEAITTNVEVEDEFLTQRTLTDFAYREKTLESLRKYFQ
ncbi:outer membrane lipoprotein-sorting protein [Zhongshania sp.]|jgi:predicted DNA binding CopG/RHH family protein|uniref:outer membrane lipoprotein-sorting protein n=1 Tax=Zhongshania sp. TaxID=1971902 RepID=UPI001B5A681C|nr:outer membrane lipoprotein-sorting protein [Zhongshania sp.]MBQ0796906.1 outer membrane lipoprotein-sorting protein [Zhongshania sp.]